VPTDFVRSARFTRHLGRSVSKAPLLFSKAQLLIFQGKTREGRTVTVRPRLTDRLAAKEKIFPRVLDGNSAHPRTPGADSATLQATTSPEHFFFRRCFSGLSYFAATEGYRTAPDWGRRVLSSRCRRQRALRRARIADVYRCKRSKAVPEGGSRLAALHPAHCGFGGSST
jgi:hypothetical protein